MCAQTMLTQSLTGIQIQIVHLSRLVNQAILDADVVSKPGTPSHE